MSGAHSSFFSDKIDGEGGEEERRRREVATKKELLQANETSRTADDEISGLCNNPPVRQ